MEIWTWNVKKKLSFNVSRAVGDLKKPSNF